MEEEEEQQQLWVSHPAEEHQPLSSLFQARKPRNLQSQRRSKSGGSSRRSRGTWKNLVPLDGIEGPPDLLL